MTLELDRSSGLTGEAVRTRTIAWSDPLITARESARQSGVAALAAMRDGRVPSPPLAAVLGFNLVEVTEGRVVLTLEPEEYHYNAIGSVHGGVYAALLDTATGLRCNRNFLGESGTPALT